MQGCVEINQCVGCTRHFFTKSFLGDGAARPSWLDRALRNRHRHAIEQASRRWRGGRKFDSRAGADVGSADGSGVSKQELSSSRMSPDPSFLHFHRPFVPTPYTQFCSGLKRPSIYPEQVSQLCGRCHVPPPQDTPSGSTILPSIVWASVGAGCEGRGLSLIHI